MWTGKCGVSPVLCWFKAGLTCFPPLQEALSIYKEAVQKMPRQFAPHSLFNMMGELLCLCSWCRNWNSRIIILLFSCTKCQYVFSFLHSNLRLRFFIVYDINIIIYDAITWKIINKSSQTKNHGPVSSGKLSVSWKPPKTKWFLKMHNVIQWRKKNIVDWFNMLKQTTSTSCLCF